MEQIHINYSKDILLSLSVRDIKRQNIDIDTAFKHLQNSQTEYLNI